MLVHKCNFLLQLLLKISANFYDFMPTNAYRSYQLLLCNKRQRQARNQWGNLAFANPKFSKTYSVVRYNSNLQSFYPPPENISWLRPWSPISSVEKQNGVPSVTTLLRE